MAKNQVQFQRCYSLFEFMDNYGSEEKCEQALFQWRFPEGYVFRESGNTTYCQLKSRKILQCNRCWHQHSLTSGTLFESTKLPLSKWFLAIHLLIQSKTGISAMSLKRELYVNYDTDWKLKHKLLQVMKESGDKHSLRGIVQIDDVYWGGKRRGGKRGRGAEGKHHLTQSTCRAIWQSIASVLIIVSICERCCQGWLRLLSEPQLCRIGS